MQLSKQTILNHPSLAIPPEIFKLPEKVLQFGTGVLLRGLPDYFIDKANRMGIFNGRIVVVKSTETGDTGSFEKQDGLYTICVRGVDGENKIDDLLISSSISRVLSAGKDWETILECAWNPELKVIISNTTEVGITLTEDNIRLYPPRSFPGKLLSFLYERYLAFKGSAESGMIIIPTELIVDNGKKLREIVLELADRNKLDAAFISWLNEANEFCDSLVDRIVPGNLTASDKATIEKKLGYTDDLMIMAEHFRLWAIETKSDKVRSVLSFSQADKGMVILPDIEKYRELKLRLLNGTHTFCCGLASLAGFDTVKSAMADPVMCSFIQTLMTREIVPSIGGGRISYDEASRYAESVSDRFRNPFLDHAWSSICLQYTSKMKLRNVPLIIKHFEKTRQVPEYMALGFAGYLLFNKQHNEIKDDSADVVIASWNNTKPETVADAVLSNKTLWGTDLTSLPGFADKVKFWLRRLLLDGVTETIKTTQLNKTLA
jgi:tagaturonate reductase